MDRGGGGKLAVRKTKTRKDPKEKRARKKEASKSSKKTLDEAALDSKRKHRKDRRRVLINERRDRCHDAWVKDLSDSAEKTEMAKLTRVADFEIPHHQLFKGGVDKTALFSRVGVNRAKKMVLSHLNVWTNQLLGKICQRLIAKCASKYREDKGSVTINRRDAMDVLENMEEKKFYC